MLGLSFFLFIHLDLLVWPEKQKIQTVIYIYMKHKEEEKDRGVCCSEDD